jgi:hypothetical protein
MSCKTQRRGRGGPNASPLAIEAERGRGGDGAMKPPASRQGANMTKLTCWVRTLLRAMIPN